MLVRWKDTPLKPTLRDPVGRDIEQDGAGSEGKAEYVELGFADFAGYVVTGTVLGDWGLVLENESKSDTGPVRGLCDREVARASGLGASPEWTAPGSEVVISAELRAPAGTASVDGVEAEIYGSDRQRRLSRCSRCSVPGRRAPGATRGAIERQPRGDITSSWRAQPAVTGVCRLNGVNRLCLECAVTDTPSGASEPASQDGRRPSRCLEATVGAHVTREGDYLCSATLLDRAGNKVCTLAHTAHLGAGQHVSTHIIPGAKHRRRQTGRSVSTGR